MDKQTSEPPSGKHTEINVEKDVSDSVIITGDGNIVNVGERKTSKRDRKPAGKPTKVKPKSAGKAKKQKMDTTVLVALIGVVGTIIAGLLSSPLIEKWFTAEPTPIPTASSTPTEFVAATDYLTSTPIVVVVTSTEIPSTASPIFTPTLEDTLTPFSESRIDTMTVVLQSTVDEGKVPLRVNFDARTSYVKFADESMSVCGNNRFCSYVFAIYRDGNLVEKISNNNGTLSYTFSAKGKYWATVYVCRGEACEDDGLTINVK